MLKNTHRPFQVAGQGVLPAKRKYYWLLYHLNMLKHMTSKLNTMQEYAEFYLTKHKSSTLRRTAERLLFTIVSTAERRECWMTAVFRGRLGTIVTRKSDAKRLSMREELRGNRYIRFGKATDMWLRLLAGKNREIFFVFQESSLAMNRKNKRNV